MNMEVAKVLLFILGVGAFVGVPLGLVFVALLRRFATKHPSGFRTAWVPMSVLGVGWGIITLWLWLYCANELFTPVRGGDGTWGKGLAESLILIGAGLYAYPFWIATYWLLRNIPRRELESESQLRDFKHASLFLSVIVLVASILLFALYPLRPYERAPRRINDEHRLR